jgi:predicted dehydrogenase
MSRPDTTNRTDILLVGTGAIADLIYLPVLTENAAWKTKVRCADRNPGLLESISARYGVQSIGEDFRPGLASARVAIIATPPRTHYPIARECLESGVHVILEKPLTDTYTEGVELVQIAQAEGLHLMVNNTRRLFQSYQEIARLLGRQELGPIQEIDYTEGAPFAWPTASGFYFDKAAGGRGVISDRGAHVLDLLHWWAGGEIRVESCQTDVDGGVEGYCDVRLSLPSGYGRMRLSWHNKLSNRVEIRCALGAISTGIYDYRQFSITTGGTTRTIRQEATERSFEDYGLTFARRAIAAAFGEGAVPVMGSDVVPSLALIDECYASAARLPFPWLYRFSQSA